MRRMLVVVIGAMLAVAAVDVRAQEVSPAGGTDDWGKLRAANDLELDGKTPFDLAMTFQLFDLDGKPTETGSVEEWWTAPGSSRRIVVHLAGLNEDGAAPAGANPALLRDSYLVSQLLGAAVHPVPPELRVGKGTTTKTVKLGKVALDCIGPKDGSEKAMDVSVATICVAPQTSDALLLEGLDGKEVLLRARTAKFHDTYVAVDLHLAYLGRDAITGKLTTMKSLDPATPEVKLPNPTKVSQPKVALISGGVIAGHRTKLVEPVYPFGAKEQHLSGTVVLRAIISKDGTVRRLVPLARTADIFTDAATDAVKRWLYSPYLLNGEPTEVDTTITVNFALNPN